MPIRLEIGPKDVEADQVVAVDRVSGEKRNMSSNQVTNQMVGILDGIQKALFSDALAFRDANSHVASDYETLRVGLTDEGGFWTGGWCGSVDCEHKVSTDTSATIRVLPLENEDPGAPCAVCGQPGTERATWAKAY